jgi:DNA mismatch endonuclease, patch repair protein
MRGNRKRDTRPETALRARLHAKGLRFRKNHRIDLPGLRVRPDVVFTRKRVAVFVDGCFWHGCPRHGTKPASNTWYWSSKLATNVARDRRVDDGLRGFGWTVIRIWEHETPDAAADRIMEALQQPSAR